MHWIDPDSLPVVAGTVERFVLNPHGEVDGFLMESPKQVGMLVHTPPHMAEELTRHVRVGDEVGVHGVRPRGADLLAAVAVMAKDGRRIVDDGPGEHRKHPKVEREKMDADGTVRLSLFGPKGELRGALLADGTVIRIGPKEARAVAKLLTPGAAVAASGHGVQTKYGRVIDTNKLGSDMDSLRPIKGPKHKQAPKHDHETRA
jgi:hypothetical protein